MDDMWVDFDGKPLKFQCGDRVKINRPPEYPGRTDGWVRGYDLSREGGVSHEPAYEIHVLGDPPLLGVRETFLERQPDYMQNDHKHLNNRDCDICGWIAGG